MNLQQLRYIAATAELGTMRAAATALHVAQPALSRAIRALERELRITIFAKEGRGLRLTDRGREVVAMADRILADVERLTEFAELPTVRVWATAGQARELVSPAVRRHIDGSDARVRLTVADGRAEVFAAVGSDHADLGIAELPAPGGMDSVSLGWQEFVLLCPPGWDLADPFPIAGLADVPLLAPPRDDWRREALECGLRASGIVPRIVAETTERDMITALVRDGAGAAFSYGRQARRAKEAGVSVVSLEPTAVREVGVVRRSELGESSPAMGFVEVLRAEAANVLLQRRDPRLTGAGRVAGPMLVYRC